MCIRINEAKQNAAAKKMESKDEKEEASTEVMQNKQQVKKAVAEPTAAGGTRRARDPSEKTKIFEIIHGGICPPQMRQVARHSTATN